MDDAESAPNPRLGRISLSAAYLSARVLVTGGWTATFLRQATAEVYNVATGIFSPTGSMSSKRAGHAATLLGSGKVLVTGGVVDPPVTPCPADIPAELYDPATGRFANTGKTILCRSSHHAVRLNTGRVLLVGGGPMVGHDQDKTMELYWP